ncbi:ATP-binding protein, partial [Streptomyces sp. RP5T]|uniref:ATP-binding protein n=2 Tax=Streptomyces TaxID=1883 RepID=UPI000F97FF89
MDDHGRGSGPRPTDSGEDPLDPDPVEPGTPDPLPYEGVWRFTAPAVEASVPQARHAVRDLLYRQGVPVSDDLVQGLLLIVSELVTNAVRHAALL